MTGATPLPQKSLSTELIQVPLVPSVSARCQLEHTSYELSTDPVRNAKLTEMGMCSTGNPLLMWKGPSFKLGLFLCVTRFPQGIKKK